MSIGAIIFPTATKKRLSTGLECGQQSAGDHRQGHVARALPAEAPPVPNASERYRVSGAKRGMEGARPTLAFPWVLRGSLSPRRNGRPIHLWSRPLPLDASKLGGGGLQTASISNWEPIHLGCLIRSLYVQGINKGDHKGGPQAALHL